MELTQRKQKILNSIVTSYIGSGEPIGSKHIAEEIGVSSATVRNEMAELISFGYLEQPHTSSGRIPTQRGYRKYVDGMVVPERPAKADKAQIDSSVEQNAYEMEQLLEKTAEMLSETTRYTAVVASAGNSTSVIKAIQFVQTSKRTAMIVLLGSSGVMRNKIFHVDYDLTTEILRMFFTAFNQKFVGMKIIELNMPRIQTVAASLGELSILAGPALLALLEAAKATAESDLYIKGHMNLIIHSDIDRAAVRGIISFLENRRELSEMLRQKRGKVTAIIGSESGVPALHEVSMVVSRYCIEEQDCGGVAILGPVRMDYPRIFAILKYTSEKIGEKLTALVREE